MQEGSQTGESVLDGITVKFRPDDFCVTEAIALGPSLSKHSGAHPDAAKRYQYLRLRKCGYTTFQAIEVIASHFGITPGVITYCGLKDEDAVTDQMIAVPGDVDLARIDEFNAKNRSNDTFVALVRYGDYPVPLSVGGLAGNAFRICVRGIPPSVAEQMRGLGHAHQTAVINYYDTQRFGVPGGPKTTHLIGAALLDNDFGSAFALLKDAKTPESAKAQNWSGDAEEFFSTLEPRVVAFFMSADSSFKWNRIVEGRLENRLESDRIVKYVRDGVEYFAAKSAEDLPGAFSKFPMAEYRRYRPEGNRFAYSAIKRPTLLHMVVNIESTGQDEEHPGRSKSVVSFFLPSGAYATNVINQLILSLQ
ncbi:tRNA pseudouridine(13) synthase TruD [Hoeflea sp. TYP-13]|uniref:tRNA pseudouridine(13) synthase TruD n=1 Tax=Hoeflea sp. TYP-13 TaxID=3230023 RepID=UPI0034C684E2